MKDDEGYITLDKALEEHCHDLWHAKKMDEWGLLNRVLLTMRADHKNGAEAFEYRERFGELAMAARDWLCSKPGRDTREAEAELVHQTRLVIKSGLVGANPRRRR